MGETIAEKKAHVRAQVAEARATGHRPHRCHATGCNKPVPPALFMCPPDWRLVPKHLKAEVWKYYNAGQEDGAAGVSEEYLRVTDAAIKAVEQAKAIRSGPVRRWADMSPEERARIAADAKPPPKPPIEPHRRQRGRADQPVELVALRKLGHSDLAVKYRLGEGLGDRWFPKSVIEDEDEMDDGNLLLLVKRWFAEKEGLIDG